jgi:hypothetical protein
MVAKVNRAQVTEAVDALRLTTSGESAAAAEARRLARAASPHCIEFLSFVVRDDHASTAQRVRASTVVLECAELLQTESRPTGLFGGDAGDADANATTS